MPLVATVGLLALGLAFMVRIFVRRNA
jgi:hypothetical protein